MSFLNNLFKAGIDIIATPIKVVNKTIDGENPIEAIEESLEDIKEDFNDKED